MVQWRRRQTRGTRDQRCWPRPRERSRVRSGRRSPLATQPKSPPTAATISIGVEGIRAGGVRGCFRRGRRPTGRGAGRREEGIELDLQQTVTWGPRESFAGPELWGRPDCGGRRSDGGWRRSSTRWFDTLVRHAHHRSPQVTTGPSTGSGQVRPGGGRRMVLIFSTIATRSPLLASRSLFFQ